MGSVRLSARPLSVRVIIGRRVARLLLNPPDCFGELSARCIVLSNQIVPGETGGRDPGSSSMTGFINLGYRNRLREPS